MLLELSDFQFETLLFGREVVFRETTWNCSFRTCTLCGKYNSTTPLPVAGVVSLLRDTAGGPFQVMINSCSRPFDCSRGIRFGMLWKGHQKTMRKGQERFDSGTGGFRLFSCCS